MRKAYQTDLSDAEWSCLEPHLPASKAPGRPRLHPLREILDAIFYIVRGGCAWRLLPHDFPPWKTLYPYTSAPGVWKGGGKGCTLPCANGCGSASGGTPSPAPG
jgi:putative transposase